MLAGNDFEEIERRARSACAELKLARQMLQHQPDLPTAQMARSVP